MSDVNSQKSWESEAHQMFHFEIKNQDFFFQKS